MKLKKILSLVLAGVMALSVTGCVNQHPEEILTGELVREVYDVELDIRTVDGKPFVIPV